MWELLISKKIIFTFLIIQSLFFSADVLESSEYKPNYPKGLPEYKQYAYDVVVYTWGSQQWEYFDKIVEKESSWIKTAQNPYSTAYGLMQFLDSTWEGVDCEKTSIAKEQIKCGVKYIENRYDTPQEAVIFHEKNNWY